MPRRLPWEVPPTPAASDTTASAAQGAGSPSIEEPTEERRSVYRTKPSSHQRANRSPSASPALPLPEEELMKPGLSDDDAYIMVEDEFLNTARTFTAHLHHAEYQRIKAESRARKRTARASPRTDAVLTSGMSTNLQLQKHVAAKIAQGRSALAELGIGPATQVDSDSDSSRSDMAAHTADDALLRTERDSPLRGTDPWLGTSLAPLLSRGQRSAEAHLAAPPSLVGLRSIRSDTRAARGYGAPSVMELRRSERHDLWMPLPSAREPRSWHHQADETETEDEDDLDAPTSSRSKYSSSKRLALGAGDITQRRGHPPPAPVAKNTVPGKDQESYRPGRDSEPAPSTPSSPEEKRKRPWIAGEEEQPERGGSTKKAANVNAIPTFLV